MVNEDPPEFTPEFLDEQFRMISKSLVSISEVVGNLQVRLDQLEIWKEDIAKWAKQSSEENK